MTTNSKPPPQNITEVVCEQIQLVKSEREIKQLLEKINDQINSLLVRITKCLCGTFHFKCTPI